MKTLLSRQGKKRNIPLKNSSSSTNGKQGSPAKSVHNFVAIGASAGGFEAMTSLLEHLPSNTGMIFVYIQHLSPDYKSILASMLAKSTNMKVKDAEDGVRMEKNTVYVMPANKELTVSDGHIAVTPRPKGPSHHLPIDKFFISLARHHQSNVIGIVLSGNATDGTLGLQAIKEAGGLTIVQDETARYKGMPESAIAAGVVDFILPPDKIGMELKLLSKNGFSGNGRSLKEGIHDFNEKQLAEIFSLLQKESGVDFTLYKPSTISRRILRRMTLHNVPSLKDYIRLLQGHSQEIKTLYQDLLINVTNFFRDPDLFRHLKNKILPALLKRKHAGDTLRIWVTACSTGEEAYSLAMIIHEIQEKKFKNVEVQIFATDLSVPAVNKARIATYSGKDVENISARRLKLFFDKAADGYRIKQNVRDTCVFAPHNILSDPPFSRIDMVCCCNMLIYFDAAAQKRTLSIFHYALVPGGTLVLGKSETVGNASHYFDPVNKQFKIFTRKKDIPGARIAIPHAAVPGKTGPVAAKRNLRSVSGDAAQKTAPDIAGFPNVADNILLSRYTPPSVVVNEQLEILQFRGVTDEYLMHPPGKASLNILRMVRPEISFEVRTAIAKAFKSRTVVKKNGLELNDGKLQLNLEIIPFQIDRQEWLLLVLFLKQPLLSELDQAAKKRYSVPAGNKIKKQEEEIAAYREEINSLLQDHEAAIEELQSANEEVISSNEELRSINEELETSKEEIQSSSEELAATNQELQTRNELLSESYNYSEAIISTMHEPMVVLDKHLRVKTVNNAFLEKFQVNEVSAKGSLLYDLGNKQWDLPKLRVLLGDLLARKSTIQNFVVEANFTGIGWKVFRLNARLLEQQAHHDVSIFLSFSDVTDIIADQKSRETFLKDEALLQRRLAEISKISDEHIRTVFEQAPISIIIVKPPHFTIDLINDKGVHMWGANHQPKVRLFSLHPWWKKLHLDKELEKVYKTGTSYFVAELGLTFSRNSKVVNGFFDLVFSPIKDLSGEISNIAVMAADVTEAVNARKKMEENVALAKFIADAIPQQVWTADSTGAFNYINRQWTESSNIDSDFTTTLWEKIVHPDDLENTLRVWNKSIETGTDFEVEFRSVLKDGLYRWYLSRAFAYRDEQNNIKMWVGTNTEIEKQKVQSLEFENAVGQRTKELQNAVASLGEKNEMLQKMNKELESFAYVSSHDLQEPLRKIQTFTNRILQIEKLSHKGRDYFGRIGKSAERMQLLIEDLLTFSRIGTGSTQIETINLREVIEEVKNEMKEIIEAKSAIVEVGKICDARIIRFQFRQLIQNLLSNSLKFAAPGRVPRITIESSIEKDDQISIKNQFLSKGYCHIIFTDNGIGFEQEFSEQIFDIFQRLHSKEEYPGTGIGLAIAKKIVENHRGIITANSILGEGTRFDIYLPE